MLDQIPVWAWVSGMYLVYVIGRVQGREAMRKQVNNYKIENITYPRKKVR